MSNTRMRKNGFLCYAHRDGASPSREYVKELQLHLNLIEPEHGHRAWCDQDLTGGEDWPPEIQSALDTAAYAVLFVNIEFLNSEFITKVELPALLDAAKRDGLLLLPLRVGECGLPDWLARMQFPKQGAGPLEFMQKRTRGRIFAAVAERVQEHLNGGNQASQPVRLMATAARSPAGTPLGTSAIVSGTSDAAESITAKSVPAIGQTRLSLGRGAG